MAIPTTTSQVIVLHPDDSSAVATQPLSEGITLEIDRSEGPITTRAVIPMGHKVALIEHAPGDPVTKYGQVIGFATQPIAAGDWIHSHNLHAQHFARDHAIATECPLIPEADSVRTFQGYLRPDGRVGTRNTIAVISTVNCSAGTSRLIVDQFRDGRWRDAYPNVDAIFAITHKGGCGLQFEGPDHRNLERVLAGFARHPNVAAYLIVGLGCEVGYASHLVESQNLVTLEGVAPRNGGATSDSTTRRPRVMTIQEQGGIARTVEAGVEAVQELLPIVNAWERTEQPASKLVMALECGGSDGNSGVTANPALGVAADLLIAQGGTAVLGETTEIYGAEHLLTRRAVNEAVGRKLLDRIRWWEWYTGLFEAEIDNNPSPGNKAGGLTTIYEKSLGALAKAGSTPLVDVIDYAAPVKGPGLVFMDTPGYDPVCTTGLVAGGANVLVFTTGRGSVLGLRPTPCVKVATNTPMYQRMEPDMDFDAGPILNGISVAERGRQLFELILEVASGRPTKSEAQGVGEDEFVPWHIGPTL